ncbi:MAG TPA: DUF6115 domain-containing protein [Mobilitalea sp.]|nr:DUF6115 domain-containing protein [Mobilitalea sp.]
MDLLEIILIILGIIIIIISCRLVDRTKDGKNQLPRSVPLEEIQYSEKDIKLMKEDLTEKLSAISEEIIIRADDDLSRISNEKIIAVSEFSDQVLEKIKNNHEEVVFLYNMLNDKEKELKDAVKEIDSSKKKVQSLLDSRKEAIKQEQAVKKTGIQQASLHTATQAEQMTQSQSELNRGARKESLAATKKKQSSLPILGDPTVNNNSQILALHSKGKSIIEISKLLDIGQGEVKLVIDLFKKRM